MKSDIADISNAARVGMGGAITAALYLQKFVDDKVSWAHFDIYASNGQAMPGRPVGGEFAAIRAVYAYLEQKYRK